MCHEWAELLYQNNPYGTLIELKEINPFCLEWFHAIRKNNPCLNWSFLRYQNKKGIFQRNI